MKLVLYFVSDSLLVVLNRQEYFFLKSQQSLFNDSMQDIKNVLMRNCNSLHVSSVHSTFGKRSYKF